MKALLKALSIKPAPDEAAPPPASVRPVLPTDREFLNLVEKVERDQARYRTEAFARMRALGFEPPRLERAIGLPRESWGPKHVAWVLRAAARMEGGAAYAEAWS